MKLLESFLNDELGIKDKNVYERFLQYNELLMKWNSKINLISRSSESIEAQVLNSIFFLKNYPIPSDSCIADIGTGGGFPGIPLKILDDSLNILMADSILKKINAVEDIVKNLGLLNTNVLCGRAETISRDPTYIKKFDIVTAKSVATMDRLFGWTKSFLKENGKMIFIKGGDISEEIAILKRKYKNILVEVMEYRFARVYGIEDKKIVIIKKTSKTE
jgi:16S rRNA (guanine527-N7)-methyltransferase